MKRHEVWVLPPLMSWWWAGGCLPLGVIGTFGSTCVGSTACTLQWLAAEIASLQAWAGTSYCSIHWHWSTQWSFCVTSSRTCVGKHWLFHFGWPQLLRWGNFDLWWWHVFLPRWGGADPVWHLHWQVHGMSNYLSTLSGAVHFYARSLYRLTWVYIWPSWFYVYSNFHTHGFLQTTP